MAQLDNEPTSTDVLVGDLRTAAYGIEAAVAKPNLRTVGNAALLLASVLKALALHLDDDHDEAKE